MQKKKKKTTFNSSLEKKISNITVLILPRPFHSSSVLYTHTHKKLAKATAKLHAEIF